MTATQGSIFDVIAGREAKEREKFVRARDAWRRSYVRNRAKKIADATERSRKHPEKSRAYKLKWNKDNPHKTAAHKRVFRAVRNGVLIKPEGCTY